MLVEFNGKEMFGGKPEFLNLGFNTHFFVFPVYILYNALSHLAFIFSHYQIAWLDVGEFDHIAFVLVTGIYEFYFTRSNYLWVSFVRTCSVAIAID